MEEAFVSLLALGDMLDPATRLKVRYAVVMLIAFVLSIAVHEFGHAWLADRLGDQTPRLQGRVTLNPIAHADPIGTIAMPLLGVFTGFVIGWGKPVMINPAAFTRKLRMKVAHMLVALAGPIMNVFLALFVTILLAVLIKIGVLSPAKHEVTSGLVQVIHLNWLLFFFNLIPVPPLDGGAVLAGLLPDRFQGINDTLNQYGFIILVGLLLSGVLRYVLAPAVWITEFTVKLIV